MKRTTLTPLILTLPFLLTACDGGVYSATPSSDGSVVVVNRITGDIRKVEGEGVIEVHSVEPATLKANTDVAARKTFLPVPVVQQPVTVRGLAKYRSGNMFVHLTLVPKDASMTDDEWFSWRLHTAAVKTSLATLSLTFQDSDGFEVASHSMRVGEMVSVVDEHGQVVELDGQIKLPVTKEDYDSVVGWDINWSGWPPYFPPPKKDSQPHGPKS